MDFLNNYSEKSTKNIIKSHFSFSREISLETTTWLNDSPGVFDYEDDNIISTRFNIKSSNENYSIFKTKNSYIVLQSDKTSNYLCENSDSINIFDISVKEGIATITPKLLDPNDNDNIWLMVKPSQSDIVVSKGDIIKLGRVKLLVKDTVINSAPDTNINKQFYDFLQNENKEPNPTNECKDCLIEANQDVTGYENKFSKRTSEVLTIYDYDDLSDTVSKTSSNENLNHDHHQCIYENVCTTSTSYCRICLCDDDDSENPLISPCNCSGSMESIHLHCLRTWMHGRLETRSKSNEVVSFFLRELSCELCKCRYPHQIEKFSKKYQLMDIATPKTPYMILEPVNDKTGFYVFSFLNKKTISIGRSIEADVKLSDISVSRIHASFKYNKNTFLLEDNNSKFGTLVCLRKPIKLNNFRSKLQFQIGNSLVNIRLRKNINWFFNCFHPNQLQNDLLTSVITPSLLVRRRRELYGLPNNQVNNHSNNQEIIYI